MLENKILATALSISLLTPLANPLLENTKATNDTKDIGKGNNVEIIGKAEDRTDNKQGVTQNIQFDFVKDKKYNKDALTLKMQGLISPQTTYHDYRNTNRIKSMCRPFQYNIGLKTNDEYISLINYLPRDKIESTNVSQTLGYNIGDNFQSAPSLGSNGSLNYSKPINYTQQDYVSEVEQQNSKSVLWGIKANSFTAESGQKSASDSDLSVDYKPHSKDPRDYFVPDNELPPPVQSGFSPSFIATVPHEKGLSDTNELEITYGRNMDVIHAIKRSTHYGNSYLDGHRVHNTSKNRNYAVKYEVSWKTYEIKVRG